MAVFEIEACVNASCIYRVLVAEDAAVHKREAVALSVERHCLAESCCVVFYRDVAECYVVAVHPHGVGAEGAHLAVGAGNEHIGMVVVGYYGIVSVLAAYLNVGEP